MVAAARRPLPDVETCDFRTWDHDVPLRCTLPAGHDPDNVHSLRSDPDPTRLPEVPEPHLTDHPAWDRGFAAGVASTTDECDRLRAIFAKVRDQFPANHGPYHVRYNNAGTGFLNAQLLANDDDLVARFDSEADANVIAEVINAPREEQP